ncbi:MAG: YihY/virulence factor BrkB family protein [Sandaracinaceae bacterium]|nr:YihY/virulence factor BrkB family protein [Sandaracinaceae bacterium]
MLRGALMLATLRDTYRCFSTHGGRVLGAATAFYALLSVAPMLLIAIAIADALTAEPHARGEVVRDVSRWVGESGGRVLGELLDGLAQSHHGPVAGIVGGALLLYASQRLFSQMRFALNQMWGVREVSGGGLKATAMKQLRKRAAALAMVVLVVLVVVSTVLAKTSLMAARGALVPRVSGIWQGVELVTSFVALVVLVVAIYKVLPSALISWRDAAVGAIVTAVLFTAGAYAVSWYVGVKSGGSAYGAAGSLVALLLWVSYTAQVFFFGAAFARVQAERHGHGITPAAGAVRVVEAPSDDRGT